MPTKEVKVPNHPQIYRLVEIGDDGRERPTQRFRVRKRTKVDGKWTTRLQTFECFGDAKFFARSGEKRPGSTYGSRSHKFREVLARFLLHKQIKERLSEGSLDGYVNRARHFRFFEELTMSQISPKAIDAWLDLLFQPEYLSLQHKTRVNYEHEYFLLTGIFTYYRNQENEEFRSPLLERHREIACRRPRADRGSEIRYLSVSEEEEFLRSLLPSPTIYDVALFQLHTGARVGEAAALEFHNVDFVGSEVRIAQHLHWERKQGSEIKLLSGTKGGPARKVPLTSECRSMLLRRKEARSSLVFQGKGGDWLTYRTIQSSYDRAFRRMGLPHRGTHTLRHSFAVRFLDQTKDIHALQQLLGHSDLKDTLRYAKYTQEAVKRSFRLFRGGLADNSAEVRSTTRSTALTQL